MQLNKCKMCGNDIPRLPHQYDSVYNRKTVCSFKCSGKSAVLKRENKQPKRKERSTSWHDGVTIKYLDLSRLIDRDLFPPRVRV
jgi:hypothetical protein